MVRMRERRAIEVEADGIGRAILRGAYPQKARVGIDKASDQPRAGDAINPHLLPSGPPLPAIRSPLQMPDTRVQRLGFIRRKVPGDCSVCFGQGQGRLPLGGARK